MHSVPTRSPGISMPKAQSSTTGAALLLILAFAAPAVAESPAVKELEVITPRAFGYVIGDVFRHRIRVTLHPPYRLETDSLPLRGRISRWLEMSSTVAETSDAKAVTIYEIVLDYQIFNAPFEIERVSTPEHELTVEGPADRTAVTIPAWEFSVAPIVTTLQAGAETSWALRPPRPPPPMSAAPHLRRSALAAAIVTAALIGLCWLRWGVPLLARANRPFARAYRDLRRLERRRFEESVYRQALQRLHRAFNETAGRAIFSGQLEVFHAGHARFRGLESSIDRLFEESRSVFFLSGPRAPSAEHDLSRLIGLCREFRDRERRAQ